MFRRDQTLYIRLAERWAKQEQSVGHYRLRPPIIDSITFRDEHGAPLTLDVETYPHQVQVKTKVGCFDWTFLDAETLLARLPAGRYELIFDTQADRGETDRRGSTLHGVRNVAYTTSARVLENEITRQNDQRFVVRMLIEATAGSALLVNVTPRLAYNRSIPVVEDAFDEAKNRWRDWFRAAPPVLDKYRKQYNYAWWIMRAGLMNTRYFFTREALVPSKIHYVGVWHWDQFFHALAYRHLDTKLAEDQLRILLDHQQPNGMIPDAIHDEGLITHLTLPVEADVTKPPLMAWTVLKLFEKSHRVDFLQEVYEPLTRWHNWWMRDNCDEHGLSVYRHPFSSGLDDSPLWDYGMPVAAPDLNTYLCVQLESLARIADHIGETEAAAQHRAEAQILFERMIKVMWDEERGVFNALNGKGPIPVLTPFHLMPLWLCDLSSGMRQRLLQHLTDPETFWPQWPLPTVAINDPKFDPWQMWRGPTWVNINYLFIEALTRNGDHALARELRLKTLDLVMQQQDIFEYYNPLTGERPPKAAPIFGWTSAVFIDLAIQETEQTVMVAK
ncbi:MAG: hypothetical protein GYB67_05260 [Chloroflexi bacterium]|nr:hypothetical protein [Chloroflexota bacterium]